MQTAGPSEAAQKVEPEKSQDSFAALRGLVERTLAGSCQFGPMSTNRNRYFEVKPQPRGLTVTVPERPYFTQKEWDKRYTAGTNLMLQFMEMARTSHPMDAKAVRQFRGVTNVFGLFDLPDWHYQNVGVDVEVEELENVYPGLEQDKAEAQKRYNKIVALLEPYQRTRRGFEPTPIHPCVNSRLGAGFWPFLACVPLIRRGKKVFGYFIR